jgi:hypothetical protein
MPDQPTGSRGPLLPGQQRGHVTLDLFRVVLRSPAEPPRQPGDMSIHHDLRLAEGLAEDHAGRLAAHSRQGHELLQRAGNLPAETIAQRLTQADQGLRLGVVVPRRLNHLLEFGFVCRGTVAGGAVPREQHRGHLADPPVRGPGGQDRRDPALLGPAGRPRDLSLALIISRVVAPASKLSTLSWRPATWPRPRTRRGWRYSTCPARGWQARTARWPPGAVTEGGSGSRPQLMGAAGAGLRHRPGAPALVP